MRSTISLKANVPSAVAGKNVIVNGEAEKITLVDDANTDFRPLYDFTAKDITYTRKFEKGYDGTNYNWQTIVLPFDVNSITIDNIAYDWLKSEKDKDKSVWLMNVFGEDDAKNTIYYDYVRDFKANHPYIITIENKLMGTAIDPTPKDVVFHGTNAEVMADVIPVVTGTKYKFVGTYTAEPVEKAYQLNETGTKFVVQPSSKSAPFYAYFMTADGIIPGADIANALKIDIVTPTLGIADVGVDATFDNSIIYNINGEIMGYGKADFLRLPKGIYIINGKKVLRTVR